MNRLILAAAFTTVFAIAQEHAAQPEHGEAGGEHALANEIWWKWANFGILMAGLGYLTGKHAGPFFKARSEGIKQGIAAAAAQKADAEARAVAIERQIGNLGAEIDALRKGAHTEMEAESNRLRAETEQQIAKIQAQAESKIASAAKTATHDLKSYAAELALGLAEQQIRNRMSPETERNLVDTFVGDLQRKAKLN